MNKPDCLKELMSPQAYKRLVRLMADLKVKYGEVKT
jgi:hypothetical protein